MLLSVFLPGTSIIDLFGSMCREEWGLREGNIWGVPLSLEQNKKMLPMKALPPQGLPVARLNYGCRSCGLCAPEAI